MTRVLGNTQQRVLRELRRSGEWSIYSSWLWTTPSKTQQVMRSLVKRGKATEAQVTDHMGTYAKFYPVMSTPEVAKEGA